MKSRLIDPELTAEFAAAKADGRLEEHYGPNTVTIYCATCSKRWERSRRGARRDTILDRQDAAAHLLLRHQGAAQ